MRCSLLISVLFFLFISNHALGQDKNFSGIKVLKDGNQSAYQTIPSENKLNPESPLKSFTSGNSPEYVFGGNVIWAFQDPVAIANTAELNGDGSLAFNAWTLNNMRASLYNDQSATPLWENPTVPYDPVVDISDNEQVVAFTSGTGLHIRGTNNVEHFQYTLPDSLYAVNVAVSRDGENVIFLAASQGNATTSTAFCVNLNGSPTITWTFNAPTSEITNWSGVSFSPSGNKVVLTGRHHLYVLNVNDGSLIWDGFVDNTEADAVLSGDGEVLVTATNSGFVQTRLFNSSTNEYDMLWQYRVPSGAFTNWASSVNISADGSTIIAGSLLFISGSEYDGSIICFDTFGEGVPRWVYTGAGDLVDDIAISDDGKVAAAVTWGDLNHTKPDLYVFDVATGSLAFDLVTPGSFFTVDISTDAKRVFAGGKGVHAREFGNGGRIHLVEVDLGGGVLRGNVSLEGTIDYSGVKVYIPGTERAAVTDSAGDYIISNIPAGSYTVKAEKPGYNFGELANVTVTEGDTTTGVNFNLNTFSQQPPDLTASTHLLRVINLDWAPPTEKMRRKNEIAKMIGNDFIRDNTLTQSVLNPSDKMFEEGFISGSDSIAIYRSVVSGGPYTRIAAVSSSVDSYTDSNVVPLKNYYYVITVFNDLGESFYSNEALGKVSDTLLTFSINVPKASVPVIDGVISPGEWDDAFKVDITDVLGYGSGTPKPQGSVFMYLKYDDVNDMLYIAGEDFLNPTLDNNEGFGLYIDDNNNDAFESNPPFVQEGNFWAYWHPGGPDLRFRNLVTFEVITIENAEVAFSDGAGYVQGEVAIPLSFDESYHVQVYGPEKTIGLGMFLSAIRPDLTASFNGWWPQTMNSLFTPLYFGDVRIDVSLDSPPQAPSDISVEREDNNLRLTWTDPAAGLSNDPLPVSPVVEVYRNGELWRVVNAGTETLLDEEVYCDGWYEYQLRAFIVSGDDTLYGPTSAPVGAFACDEPVLTSINYDDGLWDGFYVVDFTWDDNKFAVRFTPESYPAVVRRVETLVNSNDDFDFTINSDNGGIPGDTLAGPYTVASTDAATVSTVIKNIPGLDPPEIREGDFWVLVNWHMDSPGAPEIGVDANPPNNNRGMYYTQTLGWQLFNYGNIMITAYVSDTPVDVNEGSSQELPLTFDLKQNYPNPFNPTTVINYQIPSPEFVTLEIYNALGQQVRTLVNQMQPAGYYTVEWDGKNASGNNVSSGMYLYKIKAGNFVSVRKMMLVR